MKNVAIGMSLLTNKIVVYKYRAGSPGISIDKSDDLSSQAVLAVAHQILSTGEPAKVMLDGEVFELRIHKASTKE